MYNTNISQVVKHHKVYEAGMRLLELFAISIESAFNKNKKDNEGVSYFLNLIKKDSAVLDVGTHTEDYLYFLLKMSRHARQVIAFESDPRIYNYLFQKKQTLNFKNVTIAQLPFLVETEKLEFSKKNNATIIDFNTRKNIEVKETAGAEMLDEYCITHNIKPDLLKIRGAGNELAILNGATEILQKYKPKILLECEERRTGRDNILQAFKFLLDLNYSGYFILDVMKIPVANFDFNIYQNPLSNFHCKDFIFE